MQPVGIGVPDDPGVGARRAQSTLPTRVAPRHCQGQRRGVGNDRVEPTDFDAAAPLPPAATQVQRRSRLAVRRIERTPAEQGLGLAFDCALGGKPVQPARGQHDGAGQAIAAVDLQVTERQLHTLRRPAVAAGGTGGDPVAQRRRVLQPRRNCRHPIGRPPAAHQVAPAHVQMQGLGAEPRTARGVGLNLQAAQGRDRLQAHPAEAHRAQVHRHAQCLLHRVFDRPAQLVGDAGHDQHGGHAHHRQHRQSPDQRGAACGDLPAPQGCRRLLWNDVERFTLIVRIWMHPNRAP